MRSTGSVTFPAVQLPKLGLRFALGSLPVLMCFSLLQGWSLQAAYGEPNPVLWLVFATGALGAWSALPLVQLALLNAPAAASAPIRFAAIQTLTYVCFAFLSKLVQHVTTGVACAWLDFSYPFDSFSTGLLFDLQTSLPVYAAAYCLMHAYQLAERERARAAGAAQLELEISEAENLSLVARLDRAELQSSLERLQTRIFEDAAAAERDLQHLGEQLRTTLSERIQRGAHAAANSGPPSPALDPARTWRPLRLPRIRRRVAMVALAACAISALVGGAGLHATSPESASVLYAAAIVRAVSLWVVLPIPYAIVSSQRDPRAGWLRWLLLHALGLCIFVVALVGIEYSIGLMCIAVARLTVTPPPLWAALLFEIQYATNAYLASAAIWSALAFWKAERKRAQHARELSGKLSATRLANLTARLEPHFLLNALNTISELMYSDPPLASRLLLSLRHLFDSALGDQRATWTLLEEREHTQRYIDFLEARFGDRITVRIALPAQSYDVMLPRFAIQGLIENAVKHNQHIRQHLRIDVIGRRDLGRLTISVTDTGTGFVSGNSPRSGGLLRLEEVLGLLYGSEARLERRRPASGAHVDLIIPENINV